MSTQYRSPSRSLQTGHSPRSAPAGTTHSTGWLLTLRPLALRRTRGRCNRLHGTLASPADRVKGVERGAPMRTSPRGRPIDLSQYVNASTDEIGAAFHPLYRGALQRLPAGGAARGGPALPP